MLRLLIAAFFCLPCLGGGGGTSSSGITGKVYTPTGLGTADTDWQSLFSNLMANVTGPSGTDNTNQMISQAQANMDPLNAYGSPLLQNIANQGVAAGAYEGNMASQADAFHNLMTPTGVQDLNQQSTIQNAGNTLWNTASDPQNALYTQQQQQNTDQSRAAASASGLGTSPYAVGLENQSNMNFNTNWENQQLQRQLEGLQGLSTAGVQGAQVGEAGSNQLVGSQAMSALAPQLLQASAQTPYSAAMSAASGPINEANALTQAQQADVWSPVSSLLTDIMPYLNFGAGNTSTFQNLGSAASGLVGLGGLGTNMYGMGSGTGWGPLGSLFSNVFGGSTGTAAADTGASAAWDAIANLA